MFSYPINKIVTASLAFCLIQISATILPGQCDAKTMYVKPVQELALRRGQGTEFKIISVVSSGTKVKVLEQNSDYAKVRLKNGKKGWMLKRFLVSDPPAEQQLEKMAEENAKLKAQREEIAKKTAEATASLEEMQTQLKSVLAERNTLLENYQQLQKDSANVALLKKNQEETRQINLQLSEQINAIKDENAVLKKEKNLDWFIAGAAVLAIGFLLGKIPSPAGRRKRGYLL